MTRTQDRFLAAIEHEVVDAGLELVRDPQFANTGRIYVTTKGGLSPLGKTLRYNFQDTYYTFHDAAAAGRPGGTALAAVGLGSPGITPENALDRVVEALLGNNEGAGRPTRLGDVETRVGAIDLDQALIDADALDEIASVIARPYRVHDLADMIHQVLAKTGR